MKNEPLYDGDRPCDAHPTPERAQLLLKKNKEWLEKRIDRRRLVGFAHCHREPWCSKVVDHEGPCTSFL